MGQEEPSEALTALDEVELEPGQGEGLVKVDLVQLELDPLDPDRPELDQLDPLELDQAELDRGPGSGEIPARHTAVGFPALARE